MPLSDHGRAGSPGPSEGHDGRWTPGPGLGCLKYGGRGGPGCRLACGQEATRGMVQTMAALNKQWYTSIEAKHDDGLYVKA